MGIKIGGRQLLSSAICFILGSAIAIVSILTPAGTESVNRPGISAGSTEAWDQILSRMTSSAGHIDDCPELPGAFLTEIEKHLIGPLPKLSVKTETLDGKNFKTWGKFSKAAYGSEDFWLLVALFNCHRPGWVRPRSSAEEIPEDIVALDFPYPQQSSNARSSILYISGMGNIPEFIDWLCSMNVNIDPGQEAKRRSLQLLMRTGTTSNESATTIEEIALMHYGSKKCVSLVYRLNSEFQGTSPQTTLVGGTEYFYYVVLPMGSITE